MPGCMPKKIRKRKIGDKENKRGNISGGRMF